jgi:PAS domain S-box-containing protein
MTPATAARILVVEDGLIMARDIERRLTTMGYRVAGTAFTGEDAVRKARECAPDLVLMDVNLKGAMDGIDAAEQIRRGADVPIVYVTAYSDDATLKRARVTEPFGYVLKPFEERELRTIIEIALYRHGVDRSLRENEKRYRAIAEMTPAFAYSMGVRSDGTLVTEWVTDGFRNTGLNAEDLSNLGQHVHPDDDREVKKRISSLLAGEHNVAEFRIVMKSGEQRWWLDHARPLWDEARQRIVRIMGAAQDITERKRAEQNAQEMLSAQKAVDREVRAQLFAHTRNLSGLMESLIGTKSRELSQDASIIARKLQRVLQIYERVYSARNMGQCGDLVRSLTAEVFKKQAASRVTFKIETDDLVLYPEAMAAVLVILSEILDEALQRGSQDGARGEIAVEMRARDDTRGFLQITESGMGARKELDTRRGKPAVQPVLHHFLRHLGGSLVCEKGDGIRTVVTFPLR